MLDEKLIHEQAKSFKSKDKAYIHAEMVESGKGEVIISGDPIALLFAVCTIIKRISNSTETPVNDIISDINRVICEPDVLNVETERKPKS